MGLYVRERENLRECIQNFPVDSCIRAEAGNESSLLLYISSDSQTGSSGKFWGAAEMAKLKAADLILVCSIEEALRSAFRCSVLLSFVVLFLPV